MKKSCFSWDAFDDQTVTAVAVDLGFIGEKTDKDNSEHSKDEDGGNGKAPEREWLEKYCLLPDEEFIRNTKGALERTWLRRYEHTGMIVDELLRYDKGPKNFKPRSKSGYLEFISKSKNASTFRRILLEHLLMFGENANPEEYKSTGITSFARLVPSKQPEDYRKPHPYQAEAWDKLDRAMAEWESTGNFAGMLVMPTGSGKTFTAARWLAKRIVNSGKKVFWVAHRHELLEQAAKTFHELSYLMDNKDEVRVRIVSGKHCGKNMISPLDDVWICSAASLARNMDYISDILSNPDVFMVVDEAHHSPSSTYRKIISLMGDQKRVLGLTATPTRTIDKEKPILSKLFDGNIFYNVSIIDLIERGLLARPIPVHIKTGVVADRESTRKDEEHFARFNELSEDIQDKIAHIETRNQVVLKHYLENRQKYGKTLIYAINIRHAVLLTEYFRENGVRCEYVASLRPDGTKDNRSQVLQEFSDPDSGLDVLINVQILTEGVDLPSVKTVFLSRPTNSEILMRQMVGRALRGRKAGGTDIAYVVSFEDHWEKFPDLESPLDLFPELMEFSETEIEDAVDEAVARTKRVVELLPWDVIRSIASKLRQDIRTLADAFEAVPHGWFILERFEEDDCIRQLIPVYEHQKPCWDAMLKYLAPKSGEELEKIDVTELYEEYFFDCDVPKPSLDKVFQMLEHLISGNEPEYQEYEERKQSDPYELARQIHTKDLRRSEEEALLAAAFENSLAKCIYPSYREFTGAVNDALYELKNPDEATSIPKGIPVFEPIYDEILAPGPYHDLETLLRETLDKGAKILEVEKMDPRIEIVWTKRPIKTWFGVAYFEENGFYGSGTIRVNCLLNSSDVSKEAIRFLLWHEYLHLYLKSNHTKDYRKYERMWPGYVEADRELNSLGERFKIEYW